MCFTDSYLGIPFSESPDKLVCPRVFDVERRKDQTAIPLRLLRLAVYCTVIVNTDTYTTSVQVLSKTVHSRSLSSIHILYNQALVGSLSDSFDPIPLIGNIQHCTEVVRVSSY